MRSATMEFHYEHDIPTIEQAMEQALAHAGEPGVATAIIAEMRSIQTGELSTLFDLDGVALEWNQAVEKCMQCVEGTLP